MTLTPAMETAPADRCFRCDYDLRGVADEQPCPECGLIAERSRRLTDELHHTRPEWLRRTAWGIWCILYGIAAPFVWSMVATQVYERFDYAVIPHLQMVGIDLAVLFVFVGIMLLTTREGDLKADRASRRRRVAMRVLAMLPILGCALFHLAPARLRMMRMLSPDEDVQQLGLVILVLSGIPLPILLFSRLKSIAHRARSAHLAEHSMIVGIGNSLTFVYLGLFMIVAEMSRGAGWGNNWLGRSPIALALMTALAVSALLFAMWNAYLLIRFAVAFAKAARTQRQLWQAGDRALSG
jgi:hypothetical protein